MDTEIMLFDEKYSVGNKQNNKEEVKDLLLIALLENYIDDPNNFSLISNYLIKNNIVNKNAVSKNVKPIRNSIIMELNKFKINKYCDSNEFEMIEHIGEGAFGTVDRVKNKFDNKEYAIKHIPIEKDKKYMKTLNEVKIMADLKHDNIIGYHNSWVSQDISNNESSIKNSLAKCNPTLHIQMELGYMTLRDYIDDRTEINIDDNIKIIQGIVEGVKYIHSKGYVHRDLNPNNILLSKDLIVKISDFGIAVKEGDPIYDNPSYMYGNPLYTAEEVYEKIITKKADIYSIGMIYYELENLFTTRMERAIAMRNIDTNNEIIIGMTKKYESRLDTLENLFINKN